MNPKDALGARKAGASCVPQNVLAEVGLAMLEGAAKYGRHNWRTSGARASCQYDAARRHLDDWWEGQDVDEDPGLSHVTKAIAALIVLRDAMLTDNLIDDRPPPSVNTAWRNALNQKAEEILDCHDSNH